MEATSTKGGVRRRGIFVALAVLVAGGAVALGLLLAQGPSQPSTAAQLTSVQTACQQWLAANPGEPGNGQWCSDMADWMSQSMGHYGVGPQMMWGDADHMLATCEQWMMANPRGSTTTPQSWCSSMVTWMTNHIASWTGQDSWGGWMMHGSMMGG